MTPRRHQRKRGVALPPGVVYVGRPTAFGNPFKWLERKESVAAYRAWLTKRLSQRRLVQMIEDHHRKATGKETAGAIFALLFYLQWRKRALVALPRLRGKDLACWCPLTDADGKPVPCHADCLLELANREEQA